MSRKAATTRSSNAHAMGRVGPGAADEQRVCVCGLGLEVEPALPDYYAPPISIRSPGPHPPRAAAALRHGLWCAGAGQSGGRRTTAAAASTNPLLPHPPHFPPKAKHVIHLFMNGGPSHVDTFDPKPALDKVRRQAAARRHAADRAADRGRAAVAVQVSQVRPERHRSQRHLPQRRRVDRRHLRHPLDARRRAEPRAVAAAHELRRCPADSAEPRLVALLRPGQREPEPAGVRRDVPERLPDSGNAELAVGFLAGRVRRRRTSTRSTRRSSS